MFFFFFFSSRRRHTRFDCDWSSDVCSSDLPPLPVSMPEMALQDGDSVAVDAVRDLAGQYYVSIVGVVNKPGVRSEEHTSELQSQSNLVCRLLLEKKNSHAARGLIATNTAEPPRRRR